MKVKGNVRSGLVRVRVGARARARARAGRGLGMNKPLPERKSSRSIDLPKSISLILITHVSSVLPKVLDTTQLSVLTSA